MTPPSIYLRASHSGLESSIKTNERSLISMDAASHEGSYGDQLNSGGPVQENGVI